MPDFTDPTATASQNLAAAGDPDLDAVKLGEDVSDYADLDAELGAFEDNTTLIEVPKRPGYALRCRTDFTGRDIDLIRKRSRDKRFADGIDGVKFAALMLGLTCVAVIRNGVELELDGESPITLTSEPLQRRMGASSADETARKLYGAEGHVDSAGRRLMFEAGWGEDVYAGDASDPTQ